METSMNVNILDETSLLTPYNIAQKEIAEQIVLSVKKVLNIIDERFESGLRSFALNEQVEISVSEDRVRGHISCRFCSHVTESPRFIKIVNENTKVSIHFDEHSLHQLDKHDYFGVEDYRIDLINAAKLFGLISTKTTLRVQKE
jgi:hypothetical protein